MTSSKSVVQMLKKALDLRIKGNGFDKNLAKIQILSGGDGDCKARLQIEEGHCNIGGVLHGGFTATLVDCVSTLAVATTGKGVPGSSVNLNVSYLRPVKLNSVIIIEATTVKVGKSLAFLGVKIKDEESGKIVATGEHTKYVG